MLRDGVELRVVDDVPVLLRVGVVPSVRVPELTSRDEALPPLLEGVLPRSRVEAVPPRDGVPPVPPPDGRVDVLARLRLASRVET